VYENIKICDPSTTRDIAFTSLYVTQWQSVKSAFTQDDLRSAATKSF